MNVSVIVATYGDSKWAELAVNRAYPTALLEAGDSHQVSLNHLNDGTLAQSRNQGASFATADWLCFLDADDELEPGYLDAMARATWNAATMPTEPDCSALLVPLVRRVHNGNLATWATYPNKGQWPKVNECVIGTLVRRDLFERVGGFRDTTDDGTAISSIEDYDLWLRCFDAGARLVYTGAIYREHVSSAGRNLDQSPYGAIWEDHLRRIRAI